MEPSIENFLAFEREHKCNSIEVEGWHLWALYRYEIHNAIKRDTVGRTETVASGFSKAELIAMARNAIKPFNYRDVDVLFIGNGRRTKNADTGIWEDIYCDELARKYNSVILEHPEDHGHRTPNGMDNVYFTDRVAFLTNIGVKLSRKFNTSKRRRYVSEITAAYGGILDAVKTEFGADIRDEIIEGMTDRLYYVEITKKYCSKILDKAKPKLIIMICYYTMESYCMSKLGHERGIPTAEYSHGFAFPTHTPMQYNPEDHLDELPDYELIYSDTQLPIVHLPDNIQMKTVGFPFFERERARYQARFPRDEKTICFISALAEGADISRVAAGVADELGDEYHIIYKLHPAEYNFYKEKYPWLVHDKIEVIDNNEHHIYKYLSESAIQIGTRTASIWEGIGFGCKTILLNYGDTAVNMEYFIKEKNVPLVSTAQEVCQLIRSDGAGVVDPDGMFEPDAMNNISRFIEEKI